MIWLTDATKQLINFQGYQSFHSLRPINKHGGEINIFIKDSIIAKHLYMHSLSEDHVETLFIEINTGEIITYIGTIYKPPSADCKVLIDSIQNILSTINQSKIYDLMLSGDFNIDLLNKDCNNSTLWCSSCSVCAGADYMRSFDRTSVYTYAPPRCRTSQYRQTFILLSVSLWNDLSDPVFDGVGLAGFKSRANAFLLA